MHPQKAGREKRASEGGAVCVPDEWTVLFLPERPLRSDPPVLSGSVSEGPAAHNAGGALPGPEAVAPGSAEFAPAAQRREGGGRQGPGRGAEADCHAGDGLGDQGLGRELGNTLAVGVGWRRQQACQTDFYK